MQMRTASVKHKLINNTLISGFATILSMLVGFLLLPFMVHKLGVVEYGLIGISNIVSIGGYLGIFELGFQTSIIKFTAEYKQRSDETKICELINTVLLVLIVIAFIITAIGWLITNILIEKVLIVPREYLGSFKIATLIIFASYLFEFPKLVFLGVLEGVQKFSITRGVQTGTLIIQSIATFILLSLGFHYFSVIILMVLAGFVQFIVYVVMSLKQLPYLKFSRKFLNKNIIIEISKLTKFVFISRISSLIFHQTDRLLIGVLLGPVFMTSYEALIRLPKALKSFLGFGNEAVLPAASEIHTSNDLKRLQDLFLRGLRYNLYLSVSCSCIGIFLAADFINVWIGIEFSYLAIPLQIILIWNLIMPLGTYGSSLLYGMNYNLRQVTAFTWYSTILKVIITGSMIVPFKMYGIVAGTVGHMLIMLPFIISLHLRSFNVPLSQFLKAELPPFIAVIFQIIFFIIIKILLPPINGYVSLFITGLLLLISYWLGVYLFVGYKQDKVLINEVLNKFFKRKFADSFA